MARRKDSDGFRAALDTAGLNVREHAGEDGRPLYIVFGNTLPHRATLRELGGRWDKLQQAWLFDSEDSLPRLADALAARPAPAAGDNARPHYWGHRQRLRQRFMESGPDSLPDYELLELLLFYSIPRIDVKPLAKALIERFGSLAAVLAAEPARLAEAAELSHQTIVHFKAVQATALRLIRAEITDRPVIGSWQKLLDYCRATMALEKIEQFRLLFLDRKNVLIADEVQQRGTVDHTPVYPREVVRRALELHASAVIMVHNHPSGDPTPSQADIEMTQEVAAALRAVDIALHDHLVIGRKSHASFKSLRLI